MQLDYVSVEKRGAIAIVRFDRKQNINAFNKKLIDELTVVGSSFRDDLDTHGVVLTGPKEYFSGGADLRDKALWDLDHLSDLERRHVFYAGVRLCRIWEELPQLTVCAMERIVVGAGIALGMACDWRVLNRSGYIYVPETKIGVNLQWGALPRLVSLVGAARAKRITLMQEKMGAPMALDWGIIDEMAEDGQSEETALRMLRTVLDQTPPVTVRLMKEAINATAYPLHRASGFADADQAQLTATFAEAVKAREDFRKR